MTGFVCHVSGRTDPTQFFYNMALVFDGPPDLYSLKRVIEERILLDGLTCDGSFFVVSDIEILDFRVNQWVNLESRAQLYSGCFLTAIRDTVTTSCAGAVDSSSSSTAQLTIPQVLGFAAGSKRLFEMLDIDSQGSLKLKGLLRVLRKDVHYAVDAFSFLDPDAEGSVTFQQFVSLYLKRENHTFFMELQSRCEHAGLHIQDPFGDDPDDYSSPTSQGKDMPPASQSAVAAFPTSPDFSPQPSIIVGEVPFLPPATLSASAAGDSNNNVNLSGRDDDTLTVRDGSPGTKVAPSVVGAKLKKLKSSISPPTTNRLPPKKS